MKAATTPRRIPKLARGEQGFVLVTGLLFLVVMTLLGLALFRSSGLMERLAANSRDKQRSFESAQAALQYGEWWIANTSNATKQSCNAATGKDTSNMFICLEALSLSRDTVAGMAWKDNAFAYTQPGVTFAAGGGTTGSDINYQAKPGVYVEDLGLMSDGKSELYQITAYGYGGNADTLSIVRSTYKVTSTTTCKSCTE